MFGKVCTLMDKARNDWASVPIASDNLSDARRTENLCVLALEACAYLEARANGQNHELAFASAQTKRARVRKALGYSYP